MKKARKLGNGDTPTLSELGPTHYAQDQLEAWGIPNRGIIAEYTQERASYCWLGKFDHHNEAPILAVVVDERKLFSRFGAWYYGLVTSQEISQFENLELGLLEAAHYSNASQEKYDCFLGALAGLATLMPVRVE